VKYGRFLLVLPLFLAGCAAESRYNPLADYEELAASTILDAPSPVPGNFAPENRYQVERGEYLVELLGCGACHTEGALEGAPQMNMALAGSSIGIAWSNPLGDKYPGILYPPNITPDKETGIGDWSDSQIENAIRGGLGRHAGRRITVMPWQGYAKINKEDVDAIVAYLRSVPPVRHEVPDEVMPGSKAKKPFVYFGVYRSR
jgi:mono/diheme cytochrome c family protein